MLQEVLRTRTCFKLRRRMIHAKTKLPPDSEWYGSPHSHLAVSPPLDAASSYRLRMGKVRDLAWNEGGGVVTFTTRGIVGDKPNPVPLNIESYGLVDATHLKLVFDSKLDEAWSRALLERFGTD